MKDVLSGVFVPIKYILISLYLFALFSLNSQTNLGTHYQKNTACPSDILQESEWRLSYTLCGFNTECFCYTLLGSGPKNKCT